MIKNQQHQQKHCDLSHQRLCSIRVMTLVIGLMMRMDTKSIQVTLVQFPVKPLEVISGPVFHVKIISYKDL